MGSQKGDLHFKFSQLTGCHPTSEGLREWVETLSADEREEYAIKLIQDAPYAHSTGDAFIAGVLFGLTLTNTDRMWSAVRMIEAQKKEGGDVS